MMGQLKGQKELFSYAINLDKRVRSDHPLRGVLELVDFSFVRDEVEHLYGYNGNQSVPPEVILKLLFLLFFDDVASERELMRMIPERLDYLWFLGYQIDDEVPDHSVLSKARARWGREVFQGFFLRVVAQCVAAGLVEGRTIHMDGSLIDANASTDSVLKGGPELISRLKQIYGAQEAKLTEKVVDQSHERSNRRLVSKSDPDAPVVRKGKGGPRPRYKNHRAIDNGHGVITALETTPGDMEENAKLIDLVEQHQANTGIRVGTVVADRQYGTMENFRECEKRGIRSHMGDLQIPHLKKPRCQGIFGEQDFVYDSETDTYRCPAGAVLSRRKHKKKRRCFEYLGDRETCRNCPRPNCPQDQEAIDLARAQSHSREAKRDRRRRRFLMEGSFADAANNHHFKRARWRRLWRQQIQDYLIAVVQNIRILLRHAPVKPGVSLAGSVCGRLSNPLSIIRTRFRSLLSRLRPFRFELLPA
jgi:transposase